MGLWLAHLGLRKYFVYFHLEIKSYNLIFSNFLVPISLEIKLYNYVGSYIIEIDLMEHGVEILSYSKINLEFHSNSLLVGRICIQEESPLWESVPSTLASNLWISRITIEQNTEIKRQKERKIRNWQTFTLLWTIWLSKEVSSIDYQKKYLEGIIWGRH